MKFRSLRLSFGIPFAGNSQVREIFAESGASIEFLLEKGLWRIALGKDVKWLERHMVEWAVEEAPKKEEKNEKLPASGSSGPAPVVTVVRKKA